MVRETSMFGCIPWQPAADVAISLSIVVLLQINKLSMQHSRVPLTLVTESVFFWFIEYLVIHNT